MTSPEKATAIVLAAGRSQRFGNENKLLHDFGGQPILRKTVESVLAAGLGDVVVVTGHEADDVERALNGLDVKCVRNATPWAGMGTSLAVGASAVSEDAKAIMIVLGDMPSLTADTMRRLLDAFEPDAGQDIAVPVCDGRRGHPVVFGNRYLLKLRALSGDEGARSILQGAPERIQAVRVDDPGVLLDIDTPGDLSD